VVSAGGAPQARNGGTFRAAIGSNVLATIDPALNFYAWGIASAFCEPLVGFPHRPPPAGYRVVPLGAKSLPRVSRDRKTYTFTIRKGLRFHGGEPLTARNYALGLDRSLRLTPPEENQSPIVGAQEVTEGKARHASGISFAGRRLTIRLERPTGDFVASLTTPVSCPVPSGLPFDPEGLGAPFSGGGPYYVASWIPGRSLVLRRTPFYHGIRHAHVAKFLFEAAGTPEQLRQQFEQAQLDWTPLFADRAELARRYGINRSEFFLQPFPTVYYLALNNARPLFHDNPRLRRAIGFAVDRRAILREFPSHFGVTTDHYLPPVIPGYRRVRVYPLQKPDLKTARRLAAGHKRGGQAVLYTRDYPPWTDAAEIVKNDLARIGVEVDIKSFPGTLSLLKMATRGEGFDLGFFGYTMDYPDPYDFLQLVDGRQIESENNGNLSYFSSPRYDRQISAANRLPPGQRRYRAFGKLDVSIAREASPMVALFHTDTAILVSKRVGCLAFNGVFPFDLAAVCLK
jgi:peptide/nickel transport system substrate-binding protein